MRTRKGFDDTWMAVATVIGEYRSTCLRRRIGCVITNAHNEIISTGYNGPPRGRTHCEECRRESEQISSGTRLEACEAVHAEANALLQAGPRAAGGQLYVNCVPCPICARLIVNARISRVCYAGEYGTSEGLELLNQSATVVQRPPEVVIKW